MVPRPERHGAAPGHHRLDAAPGLARLDASVGLVVGRAPAQVDALGNRTHFAYDNTDARADPNVVFPLDTLRHLERAGRIGSLAEHALTFMGGIYSARRVRDVLAPAIVAELVKDEVDVAILVSV